MTKFINETKSKDEREKKPTEFVAVIGSVDTTNARAKPHDYQEVRLVRRAINIHSHDLMEAIQGTIHIWYLGHWNDGC